MIGDCWTLQKSEKGKRKKNVDTNGRISLKQIQIYHFRPVWPLWPLGLSRVMPWNDQYTYLFAKRWRISVRCTVFHGKVSGLTPTQARIKRFMGSHVLNM